MSSTSDSVKVSVFPEIVLLDPTPFNWHCVLDAVPLPGGIAVPPEEATLLASVSVLANAEYVM